MYVTWERKQKFSRFLLCFFISFCCIFWVIVEKFLVVAIQLWRKTKTMNFKWTSAERNQRSYFPNHLFINAMYQSIYLHLYWSLHVHSRTLCQKSAFSRFQCRNVNIVDIYSILCPICAMTILSLDLFLGPFFIRILSIGISLCCCCVCTFVSMSIYVCTFFKFLLSLTFFPGFLTRYHHHHHGRHMYCVHRILIFSLQCCRHTSQVV